MIAQMVINKASLLLSNIVENTLTLELFTIIIKTKISSKSYQKYQAERFVCVERSWSEALFLVMCDPSMNEL
jgi:hypothetical protein